MSSSFLVEKWVEVLNIVKDVCVRYTQYTSYIYNVKKAEQSGEANLVHVSTAPNVDTKS